MTSEKRNEKGDFQCFYQLFVGSIFLIIGGFCLNAVLLSNSFTDFTETVSKGVKKLIGAFPEDGEEALDEEIQKFIEYDNDAGYTYNDNYTYEITSTKKASVPDIGIISSGYNETWCVKFSPPFTSYWLDNVYDRALLHKKGLVWYVDLQENRPEGEETWLLHGCDNW